jgi:predicted phage terminase large subunit-like protein
MTGTLQQLRRVQQTNLYAFTRFAFGVLNPGRAFKPAPHVEAMCHAVQQAALAPRGRLINTLPPRHAKSIVGTALCAWLMGRDPGFRVLIASYGADLAEKHSRAFRAVIRHPGFREIFPAFVVNPNRDTILEVETTMGGMRKAISVGGAVTGFGGDLILIDDIAKASDVRSPARREEVISFYDETLFSRLDQKDEGSIIVLGQRLDEADIVGHLLARGGFDHLNLPAIAAERQNVPLYGGRSFMREPGDVLAPLYESRETLDQIRLDMGETAFTAQWLQNPVPPGGNRIKWQWFGTFDDAPQRSDYKFVLQSWDTAFSAELSSDFCVCITFGFRDGYWDIVDVFRQRLDYYQLKGIAHELINRWQPDRILIEKAASGHSLVTDLRRELTSGPARVITYTPRDDKAVRVEVQNAKIERGLVRVPITAQWLALFRLELEAFPNGWNDDQVDALTQFLEWTATPQGREPLRERNPVTGRIISMGPRPPGRRFRSS